jgi:hypothetical protein
LADTRRARRGVAHPALTQIPVALDEEKGATDAAALEREYE